MASRRKNGKYESLKERIANDEVRATKELSKNISLGAALERFIKKHEDTEGEPGSIAAAAEYLMPYIQQLRKIERDLPAFPPNTTLPWAEIENMVLDVHENRNIKDIAAQFGIEPTHVYEMSRRRKWKARRATLRELQSRESAARALSRHAAILAGDDRVPAKITDKEQNDQLFGLVQDCVEVFKEALADGQVQLRSARDLDTLVRLMSHLKGIAERKTEVEHRISAEQLDEVVARTMKRMKFSKEDAGIVDVNYQIIGDDAEHEPVGSSSR